MKTMCICLHVTKKNSAKNLKCLPMPLANLKVNNWTIDKTRATECPDQ